MIPLWILNAWHFLSVAAGLVVLLLLARHLVVLPSELESESVHHEDH